MKLLILMAAVLLTGCSSAPVAPPAPATILTWIGNDARATGYILFANGAPFASTSQEKFTGNVPKGIIYGIATNATDESLASNTITNG